MRTRLLTLLLSVISLISPEFRKLLVEYVDKLEKHAKETPSPFDDIAVRVLKVALGL